MCPTSDDAAPIPRSPSPPLVVVAAAVGRDFCAAHLPAVAPAAATTITAPTTRWGPQRAPPTDAQRCRAKSIIAISLSLSLSLFWAHRHGRCIAGTGRQRQLNCWSSQLVNIRGSPVAVGAETWRSQRGGASITSHGVSTDCPQCNPAICFPRIFLWQRESETGTWKA